jgi:hypothetical protein
MAADAFEIGGQFDIAQPENGLACGRTRMARSIRIRPGQTGAANTKSEPVLADAILDGLSAIRRDMDRL